MPRLSNGLFLQVLAARPQAGVPLEVTVWDGANPANMLAQLQNASGIQFQHVQSDVGSGLFRIAVADPKATTANIREGNLVKVRLNDVDVFPYFIESPRLVVAESGDSLWELKGPGALSYLQQGIVYPPGWPTPTGSDRVWTSATAGTILTTILSEAQGRGALAHVTYDFTAAVDSLNDPWDANLTLTVHAGTTVLDVVRQLVALGIDVEVTPQLVFRAYKAGTFGTDRSTSVIFRSGRHIVGEVQKIGIRSALQNAELVEGAGSKFVQVTDPTSIADPYTGRREGGLRFTSSSDPTTLGNAGSAQIALSQADSNAVSVPLEHGTDPGNFTPYADYAPGDWVALDVPGQYADQRFQVRALTLTQLDNANYGITADLNAVAIDYLVRLRNAIAGVAGSSAGATTGGSVSGSLGLGAPLPGVSIGNDPPTTSQPGDVAAPGASSTASHEDHVHGRESFATPAIALGTAAAAGAAGTIIRSDATIAAFDATAPSTQAVGDAAATGSAAVAARRDHKHAITNPLTTQDDLWVGGASGAPGRLGKGADGQVLTVDPTTHHLVWATPSAGFTNPMTTLGDLITGGSAGAPGRLGIGSTGQVLTVVSGAPAWAAGGGGGGGGGTDYDKSPNPTAYDDEFKVTAAGVPAGWTQLGTLNVVNANTDWLSNLHLVNNSSGGIVIDGGIYKAAPAVPFTVSARVPDFRRDTNYQAVGLMIYDGTKFYTLFIPFTSTFGYSGTADVATWANASTRSTVTEYSTRYDWAQYIRIVVTSATSMQAYYSLNGLEWIALGGAVNPGLSAATYVGLFVQGNQGGTTSDAYVDWIRFGTNVVQPEALLWQNVGGVSDLVKVATGAGTVEIDGLKGDPDAKPASPSSFDDEFNALSGWTTLGTLTSQNVTDAPSHWHGVRSSIGLQIHGIYKAAPSAPFTVTCKFADILYAGNYSEIGLALGDATPTAWWTASLSVFPTPWTVQVETWTNNTSRSGSNNYGPTFGYAFPRYLRLVVHSTTNVDVLVSFNGLSWITIQTGLNPGFASKIGIVLDANGVTAEAFVDWIRFS